MRRKLLLIFAKLFRLAGATELIEESTSRSLLRLNHFNKIGPKNAILRMPKDKFIFQSVRRYGEWESQVSSFLASEISNLEGMKKVLFLDIGANVGLITLQVTKELNRLNFDRSCFSVICIEPVHSNFDDCITNLTSLVGNSFSWDVLQFALGDRDVESIIHINHDNYGDSSLLSLGGVSSSSSEVVQIVDTLKFSQDVLSKYDAIVLKCDTQGYDAKILSQIPDQVWKKIFAVVVEIESYGNLNESEMSICIDRFLEFEVCSFSPDGKNRLTAREISEVWNASAPLTENLYLSRK